MSCQKLPTTLAFAEFTNPLAQSLRHPRGTAYITCAARFGSALETDPQVRAELLDHYATGWSSSTSVLRTARRRRSHPARRRSDSPMPVYTMNAPPAVA